MRLVGWGAVWIRFYGFPRLQSVIRADCGTTQERDLATRSNDDCPGIDRASELLWDVRFLTCGRSRNVCPSVLVSEF
jgi:hypothetical protein